MSSFPVVLDACVLFPGSLRDTLLRAAEMGLYRLWLSETILEEARRNLVARGVMDEARAQRLVDTICAAFPEALVKGYDRLVDSMPNDPKDRHVLAAAVIAGAKTIVTVNLKDFPPAALEPFGIEAQHPDLFLIHLSNQYPEAPQLVKQLILNQAADCTKPPVTPEELLERLGNLVPKFAEAIRRLL
jgi:predicted nucleic acid-binding protein